MKTSTETFTQPGMASPPPAPCTDQRARRAAPCNVTGYDSPAQMPAGRGGHGTFICVLLALLAAVGITLTPRALEAQVNDKCLTDTVLINTGWNHAANAVHPIGTYTPYWKVIADPSASTTEPRPAAVINKNPAWANPLPNSQWISAYPSAANDTNGVYTFEFCFCLGPKAQRPRLNLDIYADDSAAVYLNGNLVGSTVMGRPPYPFQQVTHLTDLNPQHFVQGRNCIQVKVHNLSSVAMGLDLAGFVTADGVGLVRPSCCDSSGAIIGMKYWDKNCNGKHDQGEPGLPNWTIHLSNGQQVTTDALGNYYFMNVPPGTYIVSEINQPGWTQSAPANSVYTLTVAAGQVVSNVEFGNCKTGKDSCFQFGDYKIDCIKIPGSTLNGYSLTAYLKSYLPCQQQTAAIVGVSPAGISVMPGTFTISNVLAPVNFTISGPGATAGTTVSIAIMVCCPDAAGAQHCCTDTLRVKLPDCPHNGCFRIVEPTIECEHGPNGNTFEWCFNVYNQSGFTAFYFNLIPPAGITVTPNTILFPSGVLNNTVSPRQCVTISGPGATPGATLLFYVRMCDRSKQNCCTDTVSITLPKCPEPPKGCCDDFLKRFAKLTNSASSNGSATVGGLLWAAGPGSAPIISASATLVSVTVNGQAAYGYFTAGAIGGLGLGTVPPPPVSYPFPHDISWGPVAPVNLLGAPFKFAMQFPPMAPHSFLDVVRYCIRFRYTDKNCVTCDTVICFSRTRYRFIVVGPISVIRQQTKKQDERGIQSVGSSTIGGSLASNDSGMIHIDFPEAPQELGQMKYIGIQVTPEDTAVSIDDGTASGSGYDLFFLDRGMLGYFNADPGSSVTFNLKYSGLGGRVSVAHAVTITYTVTDPATGLTDTLTEDLRLVLRRAGLQGGDKLSAASSNLKDVRTFALHLQNANVSQEPIDRLVINTDGASRIVAVGPTADENQALLQFGTNGSGSYAGEDVTGGAISVAPGAEHGPIYVTLAGVPESGTTIHFATLDATGEIISEGDLSLTSPLSSVQGDNGGAASSAMLRQSFPNPAAHSATIGLTLPKSEQMVTLVVTDAAGREVARLVDGETLSGGEHAIFFDTSSLASGTYYYTLRVGTTTETRSMQVVR